MSDAPLIAVRDVYYRYPTSTDWVLRGPSLELRSGEFVGLVGTTGAGKSTLCLALNGLIPHYAGGDFKGEVRVAGRDTREQTVADLSTRVGLVFQDADAQLVMSTVEEECLLGPLSQGLARAEARARARAVLEVLEIGHLAGRPPQTLSGGQKQRTAIAAVMASEPEVLVLDEATSELDALTVHKLFAFCSQLNRERGTTILIVSHEMELLARHADRLILMSGGRIVLDGPPRVVLTETARFHQAGVRLPQVVELAEQLGSAVSWREVPLDEDEAERGVGALTLPLRGGPSPASQEREPSACPLFAAEEGAGPGHGGSVRAPLYLSPLPHTERTHAERSLSCEAGEGPARQRQRSLRTELSLGEGTPTAAICVENVRFAYRPGSYALQNVDLTFQPGELTAIIGNNGSGKSTLMKLIVGLLKPTEGQVIVDGVDTRGAKVSTLARKIGFIFQNPNDQLFANTVEEEIAFGLRNLGLPADEVARRVESTLEQFDLAASRALFPRFLSRGDKQKVCIASIVAMQPRILLLDEPTTGQDHRDSHQILELATALNAAGMTVLLVTHDLINVAAYARRVIVLNDGRVVRDGPTADVMADEALLAACSLVAPQVVRLSQRLADRGVPLALRTQDLAASLTGRP